MQPWDGCVDIPISQMRKQRLLSSARTSEFRCSDFQILLPPITVSPSGSPWGPGEKSGDWRLGTLAILRLRPRRYAWRPSTCRRLSPQPGGKQGRPHRAHRFPRQEAAWRRLGRGSPGRRGGAARGRDQSPRGATRGPLPRHCAVARRGGGRVSRPLTPGTPRNNAANGPLGGAEPLLHPRGARGSRLGCHGASRKGEDLGRGEPGLLPAPGLQQAPVSPRDAPVLLPSTLTFPSSVCTPHPSPSSAQFLDPEVCHPLVPSGEGEGKLFRVPPPSSVPLSGDSAWEIVTLTSEDG